MMKPVFLKLKRRVILFKEIAQMIQNQAPFREIKPWLDLLSAEMRIDMSAGWKLPQSSVQVWPVVRCDIKNEVLRICSALLVMRKEYKLIDITNEDVYLFAELCSELGHWAVCLQADEVDEKLAEVAEAWITLLVPPSGMVRFSKAALSMLFASIMQFKGMGVVELQKNSFYSNNSVN